jgi:allantoinase
VKSLVIRSRRVLTGDGFGPATIAIGNGRITGIGPWDHDDEVVDYGDAVIMPGLVDTHVHVNEPGRTEWEGFETATRAAAAGGITTICDMPLNSIPPTTTVAGLDAKRRAAAAHAAIDIRFIGGVIPGNHHEIEPLARAGVCAFKCFLSPSGVPEFPSVSEADLREVFPTLARVGLPLMVHAEDPALLGSGAPSSQYRDYLASRPAGAELEAIRLLVRLLEWCPAPVHIVHLSSAASLEPIRRARESRLPLTVETCPHYLSFSAEEIPEGATEFKCAPPIRERADREGLWQGLLAGDIDQVASDHSPCLPRMKDTGGDFFAAWGGIASLQIALPAVWTGARARGARIEQLSQWMSSAPARLVGLRERKGRIAVGHDADLVVWDPEEAFEVKTGRLRHRHPVSPYGGRVLHGRVRVTYAGGHIIPA